MTRTLASLGARKFRLAQLTVGNETEISLFNMEAYKAFKLNPEVSVL